MGNSTSRSESTDFIERSDREAQIANILGNPVGGYSEDMTEIDVQLVDIVGGGGCGKDVEDTVYMRGGMGDEEGDYDDEINVQIVNLQGGNGYESDVESEINVQFMDMKGGASKHADEDHIAIYKEIKNRISTYQKGGSSSNNEFFDMLERKLNGVDSESPFMSSQHNKFAEGMRLDERQAFAEALQKGGYREYSDTETATVTAKKLLKTIVQMGGDDSSSSSEDSDFTSTEGSSGEESSETSDKSDVTTDTFAILPVKAARSKKPVSESEDEHDYNEVMSSSLETDDINLISYSPRH